MPVTLNGSTSGGITLTAESVAGTNTITLPAATGTAVVNGANSAIVSASSQASTSGTSIEFNSIPSWVKRVTVMFQGVSSNGSSPFIVQLGTASGFETSSYLGSNWEANTTNTVLSSGFLVTGSNAAANVWHGSLIVTLLGSNVWVAQGVLGRSDGATSSVVGGSKSLGGTLTRIRITTVSGTPTFDAGTINIIYE